MVIIRGENHYLNTARIVEEAFELVSNLESLRKIVSSFYTEKNDWDSSAEAHHS